MRMRAANPARSPKLEALLPSVTNYYLGSDPAKWRPNVPNYARVRFEEVYPGIDVVYYGTEGKLEFDFIVRPGADPSQIRLSFSGADSMRLNPAGDLVLSAGGRQLIQRKPVIYQEHNGARVQVAGDYRLFANTGEVQLALARFDPSRPLIIDPVVVWATYFGGTAGDFGRGIAVDSAGSVYVTGYTSGTIPIVNPPILNSKPGSNDVFVSKYSSSGTLLYSTYLGGTGSDTGQSIAVLPTGEAWLTGAASAGFPLLGAAQATIGSNFTDAFVARLSLSGGLVFSTYLGGAGADVGYNIAVDPAGFSYVLGETLGPSFPTVTPHQATFGGGGQDLFVAKYTPTGAVSFATFLGGSGSESPGGIGVDAAGFIYVAGSADGPFPTLNAAQSVRGGKSDAVLARFTPTGALAYSTYFGGPNEDAATDLAVDPTGQAYITGSAGPGFPLLNASQPAHGGGTANDAIFAKFGTAGQLLFSTYLGGSVSDGANAIALSPAGAVYLAGTTQGGFPLLSPFQATPNGGTEGWLAKFSTAGERLFSSYFGGSGEDAPVALAADLRGAAYAVGFLFPGGTFPVVSPAQPAPAGGVEVYVAKITEPSAEVGLPVIGSGTSQTLTFKFSHPQGFNKLGVVNALINDYLNGDNACYIAYSVPLQTLYLVNDQGPGSGISPGLALGSAASVANSQCTIFGTGSSSLGSGNDLTLTLNIQFKAAFNGNKVIYLAARDEVSGNSGWRTMGASLIPEAAVSFPRGNNLSPVSGSGATQVLTLTYQDATAATNLQTAWALINTAIDGRSACYVAYSQPGNALYLVPDNGDGSLAASIPLGGTGTLENSQCRISAQGSSAVASGNQLTLNLNVTFKSAFTGAKGVWAATQTLALQTSPWKIVGAWQVP